ncbi:FXYD domain-containing ion transport regulator 5 isoform X2 [Neovison vison]|uniref:FXYD domain-containing ion transport regulator 5 isoform X2 n=1 Tax=Neovison vison TaxID=452646 RepID=UPI001CEFB7B1|nr:FXYD domain-containing ion transport regulator 5 isoform X2 [Neogale vison]
MTEPVSVPARQLSPGHTLRRDAATAAALCPRGCRLGTPGSDMSPSGCLCLLTIVGLILPTRGQIPKEATVFSPADPNRSNVRALTPAPGTTPEQEEKIQTPKMESQQPTGVHPPLATDPRTGKTGPEGSFIVLAPGNVDVDVSFVYLFMLEQELFTCKILQTQLKPHPRLNPVKAQRSPKGSLQAKAAGQTLPSGRLVPVRTTPSPMMNTLSGSGGCWSQLCCSSLALSSSRVASVGGYPNYAGIVTGETIGSKGRQLN